MKRIIPFLSIFLLFLFFVSPTFASDFTISNLNFDSSSRSLSLNYSGQDLSSCNDIFMSPGNNPADENAAFYLGDGGVAHDLQCDSSSIADFMGPNPPFNGNPSFTDYFPSTSYIEFHVRDANGWHVSNSVPNPEYTPTDIILTSPLTGGDVSLDRSYQDSVSFTDSNISATSASATVNYGDGSGTQTIPATDQPGTVGGSGVILDHQYSTPGTYTVTTTITNNLGNSGTSTTTITVHNPININIPSETTIATGDTYSEDGSFSDPNSDATSWTATVSYGQTPGNLDVTLNPDKTFTLNNVYSRPGTYTAELNISDNLGASGTVEIIVNVVNGFELSGTVYKDANQNGVQDSGETGYQGATVTLNTGQSTTTDSDGNYSFSNLLEGSYTETLTMPHGYIATTTNTQNVSLTANTTENFGIIPSAGVSALTVSNIDYIGSTGIINLTLTDPMSAVDPTCTDVGKLNLKTGNTVIAHYNVIGQFLCSTTSFTRTSLGPPSEFFSSIPYDSTLYYIQLCYNGNSICVNSNSFTGTSLNPSHTPIAAVNAGGSTQGDFAADTDFSNGSTYTTSATVDASGVANPAPAAVYQSVRYGNFSYTVPGLTANGTYTLQLHFSEPYWGTSSAGGGGVGSRIFNVSVNGTQELSNFDVYEAAGGANKAVMEQIPATADSNGDITINFSNVVDNAMVSGIAVYDGTLPSVTPSPTPTPVSSLAISAGGAGSGSYVADTDYTGGTTYSTSSSIDTSGVTNPAPQDVYQHVRYGNTFSYAIPTNSPNTNYTVRLDFSEPYFNSANSRKFNVSIDGTQVLSNYDVYQEAGGQNKAVSQTFNTTSDSNGLIHINFTSSVDNAMVSGIQISQ